MKTKRELAEEILQIMVDRDYPAFSIVHRAKKLAQQVIAEDCKPSEYLHNVRRTAARGLKMAQTQPLEKSYVDTFQHILDELALAGVKPPPEVTKKEADCQHKYYFFGDYDRRRCVNCNQLEPEVTKDE